MKLFFILIISVLSLPVYSQNLERLKENNGFRKIKLNSNIKDYYDENNYYDFVKRDSTTLKYFGNSEYDYVYANSDYDKIGENRIAAIYVNTHHDLIYEICIFFNPESDIKGLLKLAYGEPTSDLHPEIGADMRWTTNNPTILCHLIIYGGEYNARLTYEDFDLRAKAGDEIYKNKQKKALKEF